MRITPERLRIGIVALAVLLTLAIVGSFFYGRWRMRHIAQDLPSRLGIKIKQSTEGFVLSKTEGGRPVFTLHAARALEFRADGHYALHDVRIDLYNPGEDRPNTVSGQDFEYDPHRQVVEARGESHLVLHAPPSGTVAGNRDGGPERWVKVTTHDLVFHQKTGIVTCKGEVDFETDGWSGRAVGAEYDSKLGRLVLASDLVITGQLQDHPKVEIKAARATFQQTTNQIQLSQPQYRSAAEGGDTQAMAEAATIRLRPNGSPEKLNAVSHVRITLSGDTKVGARAIEVRIGEDNQPQHAVFSGGVTFERHRQMQESTGSARQADIVFNAQGHATKMILDGEVRADMQAGPKDDRLHRSLASQHLVLDLHPSRSGEPSLQQVTASGHAIFSSEVRTGRASPRETTLAADNLVAKFASVHSSEKKLAAKSAARSNAIYLQRVNGAGQTRIEAVAANGDLDSSTGDALQVLFAPASTGSTGGDSFGASSVLMATQTGHVVFQQSGAPKVPGAARPLLSTVTAERAHYTASNHMLELTGQPRFRNGQVEATANRMTFDRLAGKGVLIGSVQATLTSESSTVGPQPSAGSSKTNGPIHIVAARAVLFRGSEDATFSGGARLWRAGDVLEAPVIEVSRKAKTLKAHGSAGCTQCVVASMTVPASASSSTPAGRERTAESSPSTFWISSQSLLYSDAERKASFLHHVQVKDSNGQLVADRADFFLAGGGTGSRGSGTMSKASAAVPASLEKMIASGRVRLLQPGRTAIGSRLVYTADDGEFVLTGEAAAPPRVVDADRGTVTGGRLIFDARSRAIIVSGSPGQRTTTETRTHTQ